MNRLSSLLGLILIIAVSTFIGCANQSQQENTEGAVVGGVLGGLLGSAAGNNTGAAGAVIGGGVGGAIPLKFDGYNLVADIDKEPEGYGMYTYVIFGYRVDPNATAMPNEIILRYQSLLEAIKLSTPTTLDLEKAGASKKETNLFCIPVKSIQRELSLSNYSSDVAFEYRSIAMGGSLNADKHLVKVSNSPGPFLISTLHPLNQIRSPEPMLLADLSRENPKAMREIIATYRERLKQSVPTSVEVFESFRIKLLSLILDADQNVTLVREAVAAWIPTKQ